MRVVFMGSPEFAVPSFEAVRARHDVVLAVTQPDKPAGRGKALTAPPIKRAAEAAGIPVYQPPSVRTPEALAALRAPAADVAVVVAYGKILPRPVLEAFPLGCVNVHGSILPAYRGAAPIQRAVLGGEDETGVTIMRLDEGMDTGPVLLERRLAIAPDDTSGTLAAKLAVVGAEALLEGLAAVAAGTARWVAQDDARATTAPMLGKADGALDFARPPRAVRDRIRGVDPWPGAVATLDGEPIKLFGAALAAGEGPPGAVVALDAGGATIACAGGAVRVAELQAPGKKRMRWADFVRGRAVPLGTVLGPGPVA